MKGSKIHLLRNSINIKFLLLFSFIQFPIRIDGFKYITTFLIYVVPLIYILLNIHIIIKFFKAAIKRTTGVSIYIYLYLLSISAILPIILETYDFYFIIDYWATFFVLLIKNIFLCTIFYNLFKEKYKHHLIESYLIYYCLSLVLYIAFTTLLLILPDIKNILLNILYLSEKNRNDALNIAYTTRFGWSGWSGFDFTLWCTIGVAFCSLFILINKSNIKTQIKYLVIILFLIVGNLFYGRTGLVISSLCICITFLISFLQKDLKYCLLLFSILASAIFLLVFIKDHIDSIQIWFDWVFSAFINFIEYGRFSDNIGTVSRLNEMYWLPDLETLFIGDARYMNKIGYYQGTDIGFMRHTLFFGSINYLLEVIASFLIIFYFISYFKKKYYIKKIIYAFILLMFSTLLIFFESKGESIMYIISILFPITLLISYIKEENK